MEKNIQLNLAEIVEMDLNELVVEEVEYRLELFGVDAACGGARGDCAPA